MNLLTLIEALKPSQYRALVKGWDKSRYEKIFKSSPLKKDRNAFRLYIPLEFNDADIQPLPNIEQELSSKGYKIDNYKKGMAIDPKYGRLVKIGKVLTPELRNEFNNDSRRAGNKNQYTVVISRHPYDVGGASTDRGWTSCMNLSGGSHCYYIPIEIKNGTLIAYLVKSDDLDIKNPVGRIMIRPFVNNDHDNIVMFGVDKVYGSNIDGFSKIVSDWANLINSSHKLDGFVKFELVDGSYDDGTSSIYTGEVNKDSSPEDVYKYAYDVVHRRVPEFEPIIGQSPEWAFKYANDVVHGRVPEFESVMGTDPEWAYEYAMGVAEERMPEFEPVIGKSPEWAYRYVRDVAKERIPEFESVMGTDPKWAYLYAKYVADGRIPEFESVIGESPDWAYKYVRDIAKERIPEFEPVIGTDPKWALLYAKDVAKARIPEFESVVGTDPYWAYSYAKDVAKTRIPEFESVIGADPKWAYYYAKDVAKTRIPEFESVMNDSLEYGSSYRELPI